MEEASSCMQISCKYIPLKFQKVLEVVNFEDFKFIRLYTLTNDANPFIHNNIAVCPQVTESLRSYHSRDKGRHVVNENVTVL